MFVKQISVFLENTRGSLRALTELLGKNGVDLLAVSIADTQSFGILRCVVRDPECERAVQVLKDAGHSTRVNDVLCVAVEDRPAGLADVLAILDDNDIFIDYTYSFVRGRDKQALIILKLSDPARALELFSQSGVSVLSQSEVDAL